MKNEKSIDSLQNTNIIKSRNIFHFSLFTFHLIIFLWKSKNKHAVHSPFVFSLVTKCFYDRKYKDDYSSLIAFPSKEISLKKAKLLFRVANYFKPNNILLIGTPNKSISYKAFSLGNKDAEIAFVDNCNKIVNQKDKFQLIYFNDYTKRDVINNLSLLISKYENDTLWIMNNIHLNSDRDSLWEKIKLNKHVIVTIDIHKFGFVFFRKEQAKQNFYIRT